MTPTEEQIDALFQHAAAVQPLECCGVIADGEYIRVTNQSTVPSEFSMDMRQYRDIAAAKKIEAICHSHVYHPPIASDADRTTVEREGLPWVLICWPTRQWAVIEPSGWRAPLVGRTWGWGSTDCFGLIRDGFWSFTGIELPDFDRDWQFWKKGQSLIEDHYAEAGFVKIPQDSPPQHCDIMGMRVNSPVINHLGLYLHDRKLGVGVLLHQLHGRLSVREVYGGMYLNATELHLRHRNFLTAPPPEVEPPQ